jgi:hypothetical protein
MSILKVDSLVEKTSGNGVHIAGHVIQVAENTKVGSFVTSSSAFVPNGLSVTITPKSSTSKIILFVNSMIDTTDDRQAPWTIYRSINGGSATNLYSSTEGLGAAQNTRRYPLGACAVDTAHGTTSSVVYSLYVRSSGSNTIEFPPFSSMTQYLIAQEIAQ